MSINESTLRPPQFQEEITLSYYLPRMLISVILAIPTVIFNVILLITVHRDPHKDIWRTSNTLLVINLSVCDLISGILSGFGAFSYDVGILVTGSRESFRIMGLPLLFGALTTNIAGAFTTVAMAFDRLTAITAPLNYRANHYRVRIRVFIALVWIYSLLFSSLFMTGIPRIVLFLLYCHLHISLPVLILVIVFWKVRRAIHAQTNQVHDMVNCSRKQRNLDANREHKVTSAFRVVIVLFYVTFAPLYVLYHIRMFCSLCGHSRRYLLFLYASDRFTLLNCALDPFIYAWRIPKYRRAFESIFCRRNQLVNRANDITEGIRSSNIRHGESDTIHDTVMMNENLNQLTVPQ